MPPHQPSLTMQKHVARILKIGRHATLPPPPTVFDRSRPPDLNTTALESHSEAVVVDLTPHKPQKKNIKSKLENIYKRSEREITMMEEKRGLMGRKTWLSNEMAWASLIGTSDSKTARIEIDKTELFKYCPLGLTGSNTSSFNSIISFTDHLAWKAI
jgi:hypothetical protein